VAHPGSSNDDEILVDAGHTPTLTIVANDVQQSNGSDGHMRLQGANWNWVYGEKDLLYRGSNYMGPLTQGAALTDTTTTFTLVNPNDWLKGTDGFNLTVDLDGLFAGWYPTTIKRATLVVWTDWQEPPEPPVVPAPGAVLLSSLGAGLVSLLRTRKVL